MCMELMDSYRHFCLPVFNKRTDEYGAQNFENRCRFAVELLEAIRAEVGNKCAIEYRISGHDIFPGSPETEEVVEFAKDNSG